MKGPSSIDRGAVRAEPFMHARQCCDTSDAHDDTIRSYRKDLVKAEQDTDRARAMRDHYRAALIEIVSLIQDKPPIDYGAADDCDVDDFTRGHECAGHYIGNIARAALEEQIMSDTTRVARTAQLQAALQEVCEIAYVAVQVGVNAIGIGGITEWRCTSCGAGRETQDHLVYCSIGRAERVLRQGDGAPADYRGFALRTTEDGHRLIDRLLAAEARVVSLLEELDTERAALDIAALRSAATWVLHVISGVGKAGGPPESGEYESACAALAAALEEQS